jgi:hypothetical protein
MSEKWVVEGKIIGTDKTAQRWSGGIGRWNDKVKG